MFHWPVAGQTKLHTKPFGKVGSQSVEAFFKLVLCDFLKSAEKNTLAHLTHPLREYKRPGQDRVKFADGRTRIKSDAFVCSVLLVAAAAAGCVRVSRTRPFARRETRRT